ncbi:MAG TPA: ABC transporter substrate-binding protein [Gaiellaceae bacterium]|jgi:NitT/TauT family transport system substrate-binding protein
MSALLAAVALLAVTGGASAKTDLTNVTISYDNAAGNFLPLWVAAHQGFFAQNGINANLVQNSSSATLLAAGSAQFAVGGGVSFLTAHAQGADDVFIGALENRFTAVCIANPNIKSISDLRGKKLGLSSPGGLVDLEGQVMLKAFGLSTTTTSVVYISALTARSAALVSGSIDALVGSPDANLAAQGFKTIYDLSNLYYLSVALSTTKHYAAANPGTVSGFLKSMIEAIQWLKDPANRAQAITYDSQLTGQVDPTQTAADLDHYVPTFDPRLGISTAALGNAIAWNATHNNGVVSASSMQDLVYLNALTKSGFMDKTVPPPKFAVKVARSKVSVLDSGGKTLKSLTPGRYEFDVSGSSPSAFVVLAGPKKLKMSSASHTGSSTWTLNLVRGSYTFELNGKASGATLVKVA